MAKRLTDNQKWRDPWFSELPTNYKIFYLYLLDNCDHAGIWKVNFRIANFETGLSLCESECTEFLCSKIEILPGGYWLIKKFIDFQYGGIKNDSVGKSIQKILSAHNIAPWQGLSSPSLGTKDKDKDKDIGGAGGNGNGNGHYESKSFEKQTFSNYDEIIKSPHFERVKEFVYQRTYLNPNSQKDKNLIHEVARKYEGHLMERNLWVLGITAAQFAGGLVKWVLNEKNFAK